MSTAAALKNLPRPVRMVDLPGGGKLPVRSLTMAELRRVDRMAEELPEGTEREMRRASLLAAVALAEPDGSPAFPPDAAVADLVAAAEGLTPDQLESLCSAAVPTRADAKNG